ncbi:MAG TPA: uroporphyrinogen decarboxylase [Actinomycetota bacterium]|nr:uroporphyrinogen decarboxylase [Actinomycetota bacterium]
MPAEPLISASELAPAGRGGARSERFLAACARRPVDATPVWMMRQAGRSLPAYRELRQRYGLVEITREPDLCAEVTLMPIRVLEVDAAIMFADIMLPLAGLGVQFELVEDLGPVVADPIRSPAQVGAMATPSARESVPTVLEAIRIIRRELEGVVPLIGFSGAPFTLASYLIEGRPSRDFSRTKALMFTDPGTWHSLMERLTAMVIDYLSEQVAAGVQALQLFDSWVGALAPRDYAEYVAPHTAAIFDATAALGVPRIHFGTNTATLLEAMATPGAEATRPDVVGVDWRIPLDLAWERIGDDRAVQGNLEPAALLGPAATVVERTEEVLRAAGGRPGHIFNLGHGVLPDSPLDNLKLMVDTVHAFSRREQKDQRERKDRR